MFEPKKLLRIVLDNKLKLDKYVENIFRKQANDV